MAAEDSEKSRSDTKLLKHDVTQQRSRVGICSSRVQNITSLTEQLNFHLSETS